MFSNNFSFSFIRNPLSRFLSAFAFIKSEGSRHLSIDRQNIYFTTDFDSPVLFAEAMLEQPSLLSLDHVFMPQFYYVCDASQRVIVDHLGRFESLSKGIIYYLSKDRF